MKRDPMARRSTDGHGRRWFARNMPVLAGLVCGLVIGVGSGLAQDDADQPASTTGGVFVRDATAVQDRLALAERMVGLGEWDTAAEVYQEVIDSASDRLVELELDSGGKPIRFVALGPTIQQRLSLWPEAGLAVYRQRFEPQARQLLEQAGDNAELLEGVADRFFATRAGQTAAVRLVGIGFAQGDAARVIRLATRLLESALDLPEPQRVEVLVKAALIARVTSQPELAEHFASELTQKHGHAMLNIAGRSQNASAFVTAELAKPVVRASGALGSKPAGNQWMVAMGDPQRTGVASEGPLNARGGREFANLFTFELQQHIPPNMSPEQFASSNPMAQVQASRGEFNLSLPVVDGDELFLADNFGVYALSISSGLPIPGWFGADGVSPLNSAIAASQVRGTIRAPTLTPTHVVAIIGAGDPVSARWVGGGVAGQAQLIAIDRATGKRAWQVVAQNLPADDANQGLRTSEFIGSPLVCDDTVYVVARSNRDGQLDDCYLVALDLKTGGLKFARHIASGNTSPVGNRFESTQLLPSVAYPAMSQGAIIVQTDMGAIASVSMIDGHVNWLSIYPRPLPDGDRFVRVRVNPHASVSPGFEPAGPIIWGQRVVSIPVDGDSLFVHDLHDGKERLRVPLAALGNPRGVIGLLNDRLYLFSPNEVMAVDLNELLANPARPVHAIVARRGPFVGNDTANLNERTIVGRPALTDKSLYVATSRHLNQLSLEDDLRVVVRYPRSGNWSEEEHPGNVVVTSEAVVIAAHDRVSVYADPNLIRTRLQAEIQQSPEDITPRLRFAHVMFQAGSFEEALAQLDQAIAMSKDRLPVEQTQVFEAALAIAQRSAEGGRTGQAPDPAKFFDRAKRAATTPQQHGRLAFDQALALSRASDNKAAAALLQSVLDDKLLSGFLVSAGSSQASTAEQLAVERLRAINIQQPAALDDLRETARRQFDEAKASGDPAALVEFARRFQYLPLSSDAMLAAAELEQNRGDLAGARSMIRQAIATFGGDDRTRAGMIERLLRLEALEPGNELVVQLRLAQLRRIVGTIELSPAVTLASGKSLTTTDPRVIAGVLGEDLLPRARESTLPRLMGPDNQVRLSALSPSRPGIRALLVPPAEFARSDRVVAIGSSGQLLVMDQHLAAPTVKLVLPGLSEQSTVYWLGDDLVVVGSSSVACINTRAGAIRWQEPVSRLAGPIDTQQTLLVRSAGNELSGKRPLNAQDLEDKPVLVGPGQILPRPRLARGWRANNRLVGVGRALHRLQDQSAIAPARDRDEEIAHSKLVGRRLLLTTNQGRLLSVDADTGNTHWVRWITFGVVSHFEVGKEVATVVSVDDQSTKLQMIDLQSARSIWEYAIDSAPEVRWIASLAMTVDDSVIWTQQGQVMMRRVTGGGSSPNPRVADPAVFDFGATGTGILVWRDKVLTLVDAGQASQRYRVRWLDDLQPVVLTDPQTNRRVEVTYGAAVGQEGEAARARIEGDRIYIWNGRRLASYSLSAPLETPWEQIQESLEVSLLDVLIGSDVVIAVGGKQFEVEQALADGAEVRGVVGGPVVLQAYSRRRPRPDVESGLNIAFESITLPGKMLSGQWQLVEGGLVLVTQNREIHRVASQSEK